MRQAENGDTLEHGEDVLRENFPHQEEKEDDVKELQTLLGDGLVAVQRLQQGGDGQVHGPQHVSWVDQNLTEHTRNAETDKLRGDDNEDTRGLVGIATVEKLLSSQSFRGQSGLRRSGGHEGDGGVLLHVEGERVQEAANGALARDEVGHSLAENVAQHGQENDGDVDGLRLEVENFLEHGTEAGQAKTCKNQSETEVLARSCTNPHRAQVFPKAQTYLGRKHGKSMDSAWGHPRDR